jgi:hypothetical protein
MLNHIVGGGTPGDGTSSDADKDGQDDGEDEKDAAKAI